MRVMVYKAAHGARFNDEQAQVFGEELERIEARYGKITPSVVVSEAKHKESPMHGQFTWDDTEAAIAHRKWEARRLIGTLEVEIRHTGGGTREINAVLMRAFPNVTNGDGHKYVGLAMVQSREDYRQQLVSACMQAGKRWAAQARGYRELAPAVAAIDRTVKKISRKGRKTRRRQTA